MVGLTLAAPVTVIAKAGNAADAATPSLTLMMIPDVVPVCVELGVPLS